MNGRSVTGVHARALLGGWLLASLVVAALLTIILTATGTPDDLAKGALIGAMIWLPFTLLYSLPFVLLFGIPAVLVLRRRPRSVSFVIRTALAVSIVPALAFAAGAFAIDGDWNLAAVGALAAPVFALIIGWLVGRRMNAVPQGTT